VTKIPKFSHRSDTFFAFGGEIPTIEPCLPGGDEELRLLYRPDSYTSHPEVLAAFVSENAFLSKRQVFAKFI
jgi:hypothetical protein